eukprot:4525002-Karenia_brevis.AAC.1
MDQAAERLAALQQTAGQFRNVSHRGPGDTAHLSSSATQRFNEMSNMLGHNSTISSPVPFSVKDAN